MFIGREVTFKEVPVDYGFMVKTKKKDGTEVESLWMKLAMDEESKYNCMSVDNLSFYNMEEDRIVNLVYLGE